MGPKGLLLACDRRTAATATPASCGETRVCVAFVGILGRLRSEHSHHQQGQRHQQDTVFDVILQHREDTWVVRSWQVSNGSIAQ
jgi:hypothetical protein